MEKDENGQMVGGWPIGFQYNYEQTKTMEERRAMVKVMLDEYHPSIPILIDRMDNNFNHAYHAWPDRALVFEHGSIRYISATQEDGTRTRVWTDEIADLFETELD